MEWAELIAKVVGGLVALLALVFEVKKRKDAEVAARDWEAEASLERNKADATGNLLRERNEEIRHLRAKLPIRDRFERLFDPSETN